MTSAEICVCVCVKKNKETAKPRIDPRVLRKFDLKALVNVVSRERVLYVLPVPRVKQSAYDEGLSGV